jgi:hypothetical protein
LVVGHDLFHDGQAFFQLFNVESEFLVLIEIGVLSYHAVGPFEDILEVGGRAGAVFEHECAACEPSETMLIVDDASIGQSGGWVGSSSDEQFRSDAFLVLESELVLDGLPGISIEVFLAGLAVGSTPEACQFEAIIEEYILAEFASVIEGILFDGVELCGVVRDGWEIEGSQHPRYLSIYVF